MVYQETCSSSFSLRFLPPDEGKEGQEEEEDDDLFLISIGKDRKPLTSLTAWKEKSNRKEIGENLYVTKIPFFFVFNVNVKRQKVTAVCFSFSFTVMFW